MSERADHIYDVVVVGCGPVGAVLANLLGARRLDTLVVERDREPYDLPRAINFDHEIMRILQSAGLADVVAPHVYSPAGAMFFGASGWPIRRYQPNEHTAQLGWPTANSFYQPDLERVLRAEAEKRPGVEIRYGHAVEQVTQDDDLVKVEGASADGRFTVRARYLVGCDGGRSTIRQAIGAQLDDLGFEEPWIVVDAFVDGPVTLPHLHGLPEGVDMQEVLFIIGDPARPTSVIPGIGRHRRWEFMLMPHERPEDYNDPARAAALIAPFVRDASYQLIRTAVYRFHALIAPEWRKGRIFLAGDSAHQTPPFFGQGMCHGIRDAANLTWKLAAVLRGAASEAILETYDVEREPQVRSVIEAAVNAGRYLCTLDPAVAKRRDEEMQRTAAAPATSYLDLIPPLRAGFLARPRGGDAPDPTGARFIQPPMEDADRETRLLDDWAGDGFTLLTRGAPALGVEQASRVLGVMPIGVKRDHTPDAGVLLDRSGELIAWMDHYRCDAVLVRPDAYVFGVADGPDAAAELLGALRVAVM